MLLMMMIPQLHNPHRATTSRRQLLPMSMPMPQVMFSQVLMLLLMGLRNSCALTLPRGISVTLESNNPAVDFVSRIRHELVNVTQNNNNNIDNKANGNNNNINNNKNNNNNNIDDKANNNKNGLLSGGLALNSTAFYALQNTLASYTPSAEAREWLVSLCSFIWREGKYSRIQLHHEPGVANVLLLCWEKGSVSPVHSHGSLPDSQCFIKVLSGKLRERVFEMPPIGTHGTRIFCEDI